MLLPQSENSATWAQADAVGACLVTNPLACLLSYGKHRRYMGYNWPDPEGHDVPVMECSCGLYACTDPNATEISRRHGSVFGVVEMSGGVVYHEKNTVIRAAKATIVALCMPKWDWKPETVVAIRARYPGVRIFRSRKRMLKEYPPQKRTREQFSRWYNRRGAYFFITPFLALNTVTFAMHPVRYWYDGLIGLALPVPATIGKLATRGGPRV